MAGFGEGDAKAKKQEESENEGNTEKTIEGVNDEASTAITFSEGGVEEVVTGDQMATALQSIAQALSQMQAAMETLRGKMQKTDRAVRGVARRLRAQGSTVQRVERRVRALENQNPDLAPARSRAHAHAHSHTHAHVHAPSLTRFSSPARPSFVVRALPPAANGGSGGIAPAAPPAPPPPASWAVLEESMATLGKCLLKAAQNGRTKYARELLAAGADVDFRCGSEWTPLHRAAAKAHDGVVALLLEHGADVKAKNSYGFSALHIAAYHDFTARCVRLLIAGGCDVHSKNRSGRTALHYAAEAGNIAAVRALLAAGAKGSARDDEGRTPANVAKTARVKRLLRTAAAHGAGAAAGPAPRRRQRRPAISSHVARLKFARMPSHLALNI